MRGGVKLLVRGQGWVSESGARAGAFKAKKDSSNSSVHFFAKAVAF